MLAALLNETQLQFESGYLKTATIESVYFGGGTPSLLELDELTAQLQQLRKFWTIAPDAEITLEANPDDITNDKLAGWRKAGINRLSIGIQSLFDEDLMLMNRAHTAAEAKVVIQKARDAGFENFTVDLIYGIPGLTDERWNYNLNFVLSQGVNHVSCYALTVEPKTPLEKQIRLQKTAEIDVTQQNRQFFQLMKKMEEAGFEHYEISNFAKPGHRSKHNSSYWKGTPYLGLGPSAHSFNGHSRQWNVANNQKYTASLLNGKIPFEKEELTPVQKLNEYIMTSIRLIEGCNVTVAEKEFGPGKKEKLLRNAQHFIDLKWMTNEEDYLKLTSEGKLFADKIAAELFF